VATRSLTKGPAQSAGEKGATGPPTAEEEPVRFALERNQPGQSPQAHSQLEPMSLRAVASPPESCWSQWLPSMTVRPDSRWLVRPLAIQPAAQTCRLWSWMDFRYRVSAARPALPALTRGRPLRGPVLLTLYRRQSQALAQLDRL